MASVLIAGCDGGATMMLAPEGPHAAPETPPSAGDMPPAVGRTPDSTDLTDGSDGRGAAPPSADAAGPGAMLPPAGTPEDNTPLPQAPEHPSAVPPPDTGAPSAAPPPVDPPPPGPDPSEPGDAPDTADDDPDAPDDPPPDDPPPVDPAPGDPGDPGAPDDPDPNPPDPSEPEPVDEEPAPPQNEPTQPTLPVDPAPDLPGPSPGEPPAGGDVVGPESPEIPSGLPSFHISVIGSSTASGFGASSGTLAWASLLEASLNERVTTRVTTSNLAVGGYTAYDLAPGSGTAGSIDNAISEKPDLIIVALAGSNDLDGTITTEFFISQLVALRETAKAAGIPTFFMGTLPKNFTDDNRRLLVAFDRAMASEFGACWIPGTSKPYAPCYIHVFESLADSALGLAPEYDSGDGQHPNDAGHAVLFQAAAAIVEPYVCSKTSCR
jgi:lysophospholipase L1-like esterase